MHRARPGRGRVSPSSRGDQRRSRHNLRPLGKSGHKFWSASPDARKDSAGQSVGEDHPGSLRTSRACRGKFAKAFAIEVRCSDKEKQMFNSLDEQIKRDDYATSTPRQRGLYYLTVLLVSIVL